MGEFFPSPDTADPHGLVAVTDDMTPELVLEAYRSGIFPWSTDPVRWYSPDPRAIFLRETVHIPRRLVRDLKNGRFKVTFDTSFEQVIRACAEAHSDSGVWITETFIKTYCELHRQGYAHSTEVWQDDQLVGGLYGVQLAGLFAGESMFHKVSNASKVAFAYTARHLDQSNIPLFDAQVINEHTYSLGAVVVRRQDYLVMLKRVLRLRTPYDGKLWPHAAAPW
jgi:leucyl/phenylalanyl-tRNA--protein transferase